MVEGESSRQMGIMRVAFCPHCGNRAPQHLAFQHDYTSWAYDEEGTIDFNGPECTYFVAICHTCNELLLYHSFGG